MFFLNFYRDMFNKNTLEMLIIGLRSLKHITSYKDFDYPEF